MSDIDSHLEARKKAAANEREANREMLKDTIDAGDRLIAQQAVMAAMNIAQTPISDPQQPQSAGANEAEP